MSLLRSSPTRIYYGDNRSSASFDEIVVATGVAAGMLGLAWLLIWPTAKRARNTLIMHAAHAFAIYVFVVPILGLVCKSWQSGTIRTSAQYAAYSASEVNGTVGLYVGLGSFNVTLRGDPEYQNTTATSPTEQINYNENVKFGERQGRVGFGEQGNAVNQEYRRLQNRGLPYPLAWVMELFTNDGDGMRWGRNYRQAGYFAAVLLWTSVALWAITLMTLAAGVWGISASVNEERDGKAAHAAHAPGIEGGTLRRSFLLRSQLRPASILCACTGLLQTAAPCIYVAILHASPGTPVSIQFSAGSLELTFGWCFWLILCTGIVVLALGLAGVAWTTYGYSERIRQLDYVWADVPPEKPRHAERTLGHRRARSMSTEIGSTYAPRPHHRSQGSGVGSSVSESVKSPESAVLTGPQATSPIVLGPPAEQTQQTKQQQPQSQPPHAQPAHSVSIEMMPSAFPSSSIVPSAVSSVSASSTPTSGVRASVAAAHARRRELEAIPDASEEQELASASTPMAHSQPAPHTVMIHAPLDVASGSPAAAPAASLTAPVTEPVRIPVTSAPPALFASTPSALPLYSGPSTGLLDTNRADDTMLAAATTGPRALHFVYGQDAADKHEESKGQELHH